MLKPRIWIAAAILTALASLGSILFRHRVEASNRRVAIVAEVDLVNQMAGAEGRSLQHALLSLKAAGLTSIAVSEDTVGDLLSVGQLRFEASGIDGMTRIKGSERAMRRLQQALHATSDRFPQVRTEGDTIIAGVQDAAALRSIPVGLSPESVEAARGAGLNIVARYANGPTADPAGIKRTLTEAREAGVFAYLPLGDQVLGRRSATVDLIDGLRATGIAYASPEFSKIGGDANVVEDAPEILIRLHAAQLAEMDKMTVADAVERYSKAARERNIRILLIRPLAMAGATPVEDFGSLIEKIVKEIKKEGGDIGVPAPFVDPGVPSWLPLLIAIFAAPVVIGVGATFVSGIWRTIGTVLVAMLALACFKESARPYMALIASIAFPTATFILIEQWRPRNWLVAYLAASLFSLVGGLAVAGMLNSLAYMVRADQFLGVKAAHYIPVVLVGIYLLGKLGGIRTLLSKPIVWWQAIFTLAALAVLGLMLMRTGNDNPAAVSGFELKIRSLLDQLLVVRPRTKEFMFGHPLMVLGLALMAITAVHKPNLARFGGVVVLLLLGGVIGQTSIVNTMCHLHTPIVLSLVRIVAGLVLGGILGAVVWYLIARRFVSSSPTLESS